MLALSFAGLTRDPISGRVVGLCALALAVRTLRLAPHTATGSRRLIARLAAALAMVLASLHAAGPAVLAHLDAVAPIGLQFPGRERWAAALVAAACGWTWSTSPAIRG